jgi:hypothetical protein
MAQTRFSIQNCRLILACALVLLLLALSFGPAYELLWQTHLATGLDGYYYVLQIEALRNSGRFYFPTRAPVSLYLLLGLRLLTQDPIAATKLGGLISHAALSFGVFCLLKILTGRRWLGLFGLALASLSGLRLYFVGEFLSQLAALAWLVWGFVFLFKAIQGAKWWWAAFFVCLTLAVFSHRSLLPLAALISFAGLTVRLLSGGKEGFRRNILLLSGVIAILLLPFLLAWQPLVELPRSWAAEFLRSPRLPFDKIALPEHLALTLVSAAAIFLYFRSALFARHRIAGVALGAIVLWSLWLNLNPFLNHRTGFTGIAGRLSGLAYIQVAVAAPLLLFFLFEFSRKTALAFALLTLAALGVSYFSPPPQALRPEYVRKRESLAQDLSGAKDRLCPSSFIVARHGEQFLVTALTGFPAQQKPPAATSGRCLYWLLHQPENTAPEFVEAVTLPSAQAVLVKNEQLPAALKSLSPQELQKLTARNPHLKVFLR